MTIKDRVYSFIREANISVRQFEQTVGLSNGAVAKMGNSTRRSVLDKIVSAFPQINQVWLLTGEGDMIRKDFQNEVEDISPEERRKIDRDLAEGRATMIPLIHIDSVGGVYSSNELASSEQYIERMLPFPGARPGDVAIIQSGSSMAPTIPAGAILQIRRVDNWQEYFGYGGDFVLWLTDDRRITKQVLKYGPDPANYVTCHSYNPESADEELPKSMIKQVWKVVNVLINKGW